MKYCDYGHKNITTGLCIATTGVNFDYLIITYCDYGNKNITTRSCIATVGVDFDHLIYTTGLHIVTTGTIILLRVCVSRLRVDILIT